MSESLRPHPHPDQLAAIRKALSYESCRNSYLEGLSPSMISTVTRRFSRLPQMRYIRPADLAEFLVHPNHGSAERMLKSLSTLGRLWASSFYPYLARAVERLECPAFYDSPETLDARAFMLEPPSFMDDKSKIRVKAGWAMEPSILALDGHAGADRGLTESVGRVYPEYGVSGRPDEVSVCNEGDATVWQIADAKLSTGYRPPPASPPGYYIAQLHCYRLQLVEVLNRRSRNDGVMDTCVTDTRVTDTRVMDTRIADVSAGGEEAVIPGSPDSPGYSFSNSPFDIRMCLYRRHLDRYVREQVGLERIAASGGSGDEFPGVEPLSPEALRKLLEDHSVSYRVDVEHDALLSEAIVNVGRMFRERLTEGCPMGLPPIEPYDGGSAPAVRSSLPVREPAIADTVRDCLLGSPKVQA